MLHRTEGIVLRTVPYGEADLIVTYLTRDHGLISAFAKSPRKTKSRFGSSLEPLTLSSIALWGKEDARLPRLTQSDIIHPFSGLRSSLPCFLRVSELIEILLHCVPEQDPTGNIYPVFIGMLYRLESDCTTDLLVLYCKLTLLGNLGYLPRLGTCGKCGGKSDAFFLSHGTVLCKQCSQGFTSPLRLSPGVISLYMTLTGWDPSKIARLKPGAIIVSELATLIDEHLKYVIEKKLRTSSFSGQKGAATAK